MQDTISVGLRQQPLRLQQVEVAWGRQNLYFISAAGHRYTLYVGGEQMHAPEYELRRLLPAQPTLLEPYATVSLGDIQPHVHYHPHPAQGKVEHTLLTVVVLVLVCGLGLWAYRLLKAATRAGTVSVQPSVVISYAHTIKRSWHGQAPRWWDQVLRHQRYLSAGEKA